MNKMRLRSEKRNFNHFIEQIWHINRIRISRIHFISKIFDIASMILQIHTVDLISFHFCPGIKSQLLVIVGGVLIKFIFMGPHKETMKQLQGANHIHITKNGIKKNNEAINLKLFTPPASKEKEISLVSFFNFILARIAMPFTSLSRILLVLFDLTIYTLIEHWASSFSFDWAFDSKLDVGAHPPCVRKEIFGLVTINHHHWMKLNNSMRQSERDEQHNNTNKPIEAKKNRRKTKNKNYMKESNEKGKQNGNINSFWG